MHRCSFVVTFFFAFSFGMPIQAQTPPMPPPEPMTLQQALAQLSPMPAGITLTVGPQWVTLPTDQTPPKPSSSPSAIAQLFGNAKRRFGHVDTIALPTMVLLGEPQGDPNPYVGMSSDEVIPLFADSLSKAQWADLTSEQGLSIASLSQTQQELFAQLLPDGQLKVYPWSDGYTPSPSDSERDLSDELMSARLRLKQATQFAIPSQGEDHSNYFMYAPLPPGPPVYKLLPSTNNARDAADVIYGQQVRAEVPNAPKHGQLNLKLPVLQTPIPVNGLKTVGDLMARIGQSTHVELYADRRLEQKTLMILGTGLSAPAADLLQAVAFCLTSTYRQVGPAYVLTDDIEGIATRMMCWHEFEKYADALRQQSLIEARVHLRDRYGKQTFSAFGDPLALTKDQQKLGYNQGQTLSQLTPGQQQAVQALAARRTQLIKEDQFGAPPLNLDGKISVSPVIALQLIVPSLQAPIDTDIQLPGGILFGVPPTPEERKAEDEKQIHDFLQTPDAVMGLLAHPEAWNDISTQYPELAAQFLAAHSDVAVVVNSPRFAVPKLTYVLKQIPNRAALVSPSDAASAISDVTAAQVMGLTQLWVSVFADGKTNLKPLAAAIKRSKGTSLQIFAVVNTLSWGDTPPLQDTDLNLLGENSEQAETRHQQRYLMPRRQNYDEEDMDIEQAASVVVNPLAPDVQQTLLVLVRSLKRIPNLAGIVFRETSPPGYDLRGDQPDDTNTLLLGYQAEMRLAFLRAHHADPIDVFSAYNSTPFEGKANTSLPNFQYDGDVSDKVTGEWDQYRRETDLALLHTLQTAALPLHILIKLRGPGPAIGGTDDGSLRHHQSWYGSWDNPKALPPTLYSYRDDIAKQPLANQDALIQAKSQSPLIFGGVPLDESLHFTDSDTPMILKWRQNLPSGFVLEIGDKRLSQLVPLFR